MVTSPPNPRTSLTTEEIDGWLSYARIRRAQLHVQAGSPVTSDERQEAFTAMSALLLEAFEAVHVLRASVQERSQAACAKAGDLTTKAIPRRDEYITRIPSSP